MPYDDDDPLDEHDRDRPPAPSSLPYIGPLGVELDADYLLGWVLGDPRLNISSDEVLRCPFLPVEEK